MMVSAMVADKFLGPVHEPVYMSMYTEGGQFFDPLAIFEGPLLVFLVHNSIT
jgi:hypothetical protein